VRVSCEAICSVSQNRSKSIGEGAVGKIAKSANFKASSNTFQSPGPVSTTTKSADEEPRRSCAALTGRTTKPNARSRSSARKAHSEAEPWGSASQTSTEPRAVSAEAKKIDEVVLPVPPLVLAITILFMVQTL